MVTKASIDCIFRCFKLGQLIYCKHNLNIANLDMFVILDIICLRDKSY